MFDYPFTSDGWERMSKQAERRGCYKDALRYSKIANEYKAEEEQNKRDTAEWLSHKTFDD